MIPHPSCWMDNPPPLKDKELSMWRSWLKTLAGWVIKLGPGLVQAILEAKAKEPAQDSQP